MRQTVQTPQSGAPSRDGAEGVQAVLFDKDGTLIDFQGTWAPWTAGLVRRTARETGVSEDEVATTIGFDLAATRFHADSPVIAGTPDEAVALMAPFYPHLSHDALSEKLVPVEGEFILAPVPGMRATCEALKAAGVQLGVVTNDFEADARAQIQALGLADVMSVIIGFDSGYGGKPAPDGCLAAANALGVAPENCVMVGDSLHDLHAGRAAGMGCVGVLTGVAGRAELAPHADVVLPSLAGLPAWLASSATAMMAR